MKPSQLGRGDLIRAWQCGDQRLVEDLAVRLGLELLPASAEPRPPSTPQQPESVEPPAPVPTKRLPFADVPFWRSTSFSVRNKVPEEEQPRDSSDRQRDNEFDPPVPLTFQPLAPPAALLTSLRRLPQFRRTGKQPDLEKIVERISQVRDLHRLPRRQHAAWGPDLHIVVDRSRRLIPYWSDQDFVCQSLLRLLSKTSGSISVWAESRSEPLVQWPEEQSGTPDEPPAGSVVLALTDLGCLQHGSDIHRRRWLNWGERLMTSNCRRIALVPCLPADITPPLTRLWQTVAWSKGLVHHPKSRPSTQSLAERLIGLLWPALRFEPHLLRAIRKLVPLAAQDPGLESHVWQHESIIGSHSDAATIRPEHREKFQAKFQAESPETRAAVIRLLRNAHSGQYEGIWNQEITSLGDQATEYISQREIEDAHQWFRSIPVPAKGSGWSKQEDSRVSFFRVAGHYLSDASFETVRELSRLWDAICGEDPNAKPPGGFDPLHGVSSEDPIQTLRIAQATDSLCLEMESPGSESHSRSNARVFGSLRYRSPWVGITPLESEESLGPDFWKSGKPPAWATNWGHDEFGAWSEFEVRTAPPVDGEQVVTQRMRWIEPGSFLMGSPADEQGRWTTEGPQHQVTISNGFWMFDAPSTQGLWTIVVGSNPSRFVGSTRPVERVSWNDCQQFVDKLNELFPDLGAELPTEAEWEYACRAGTVSATYNGDLEMEGDEAAQLDPIAWYSVNSANGTQPVRQKAPNPWGLFDTLGNVWEWCRDAGGRRYEGWPIRDPFNASGEASAASERVIRGGCWLYAARLARAASRSWNHREGRHHNLGFRCRVQGEASEPASGEASDRRRSERSRGESRAMSGARETWIQLAGEPPYEAPLPESQRISIRTDRDRIVLQRIEKPEWASAIGRDPLGLWAELEIQTRISGPRTTRPRPRQKRGVVTQRLRRIPPGQNVLGSPLKEPGRQDWEFEPRLELIEQGFWLFDTPCPQSLWEELMGDNPSQFQSPDRPVENVSWDDCQRFLSEFNQRFPKLSLRLPSEMEWEYACRADTTEATYAGPIEILGENNAPVLDKIAWYGGNCGVEFDLSDGRDTSAWPEKQYDFAMGGTRVVGTKSPNSWGLYDMLGNVYEWCEDAWVDPSVEGESSGADDPTAASERVVRGGSWGVTARGARAAYRNGNHRENRYSGLGFRCLVQ